MKVIERFNVSKPPEGPRTFTFQLSGAGLASVVVVGALCLVWVFILGVLVGRGYKPEAAVPELAQMMPSAPAPRWRWLMARDSSAGSSTGQCCVSINR